MPFSPNASLISTDMDNTLRGFYRDNSDSVLTGTVAQTNLKLIAIGSGVMGPTGAIHVIAAGTLTGTAGTKTLRINFGSTTVATIVQAAGTTSDWYFDAWCFNVATNLQRWFIQRNGNDLLSSTFDYTTSAEDTSSSRNVAITGQLGNAGDTITGTMMDVFIVQVQ